MKPLRLAINVLAGVGACALFTVGWFWHFGNAVFGGTDEPSAEEIVASPDGNFRAVRISSAGGGAAGWCREFVIVQSSTEISSIPSYPQAQGELVFSANCNTGITLSWAAPSQLVVRYKMAPGTLTSFEARPTNKSQNVAVRVEPDA